MRNIVLLILLAFILSSCASLIDHIDNQDIEEIEKASMPKVQKKQTEILWAAIKTKNLKIIELVLQKGIHPDLGYSQGTPINIILGYSSFPDQTRADTLSLLLKYGADPNLSINDNLDSYSYRPSFFHELFDQRSYPDIEKLIQLSIDNGADINSFGTDGKSVLERRIRWGGHGLEHGLELAAKFDADPTIKNAEGLRPYEAALVVLLRQTSSDNDTWDSGKDSYTGFAEYFKYYDIVAPGSIQSVASQSLERSLTYRDSFLANLFRVFTKKKVPLAIVEHKDNNSFILEYQKNTLIISSNFLLFLIENHNKVTLRNRYGGLERAIKYLKELINASDTFTFSDGIIVPK